MGKYFEWNLNIPKKDPTSIILKRYLNSLGFNYIVELTDNINIGETIVDHPEVTESTDDDWTGFFDNETGIFYLFFKNEIDATAAKLRWL